MNASIEKAPELPSVVQRFVQDAGNATQSFGIGRVLGQLYAYLYFSSTPRSLADMQAVLGISKGSASTGVRQLEQWGAVRKVWVKGVRRDFYEANDWFGQILKNAVADLVGSKLSAYTALLNGAPIESMGSAADDGDKDFIEARIRHLQKFHDRAQRFWNSLVLKALLK